MTYRFGPFTADRRAYRVLAAGQPIDLTPKLLDLLFHLLERPATLVTKEELLDAVWPDANVTENALAQAMSELRDVLGDAPARPTYIRTIARRGYRFIAPVEVVAVPAAAPPAAAPTAGLPLAEGRRTVAVLDFGNVTGDEDAAWLSAGIAETVTNDLSRIDAFSVVDRWRALQAARHHESPTTALASLGADLIVTGSFQRVGTQLRITARMTDIASGQTVADAKIDGPFASVFELQDGIAASFAHSLGVATAARTHRVGVRETADLEAYRAFMEGLLKIESLDTSLVPAAIEDFERAIAHDSGYAVAYTGLASAKFVAYEMTRVSPQPNHAALASGIDDAKRAIDLDGELAEAHATLSFLLVSAGAFDEARTAARRAVALEPDSWRHQYRLGHALWGTPRLKALERALALYPQFAFATFESVMLHVARGDFASAERLVRRRLEESAPSANRFPGVGFHWLQGALEAEGGRHDSALAAFAREGSALALRRLYGPEYAAEALASSAFSLLELGDAEEALASARAAQAIVPGHARATLGEALSLETLGRKADAARAWQRAEAIPAELTRTGRPHAGRLALGLLAAARGRADQCLAALQAFLDHLPPCHLGWTIPLDPVLAGFRSAGILAPILGRLADRAR
jgi:DNA-binding winged helix-turn-helix (wHTH) protein/tetratricopeptide (TPR) repeat protein